MTDLKQTRKSNRLAIRKETLKDLTVRKDREVKGGAYSNLCESQVGCGTIATSKPCR